MGENPASSSAHIRQTVQKAAQNTWSDEILHDHPAEQSDCQEMVQIHFPEVTWTLSEKNMTCKILKVVAHLKKGVGQ